MTRNDTVIYACLRLGWEGTGVPHTLPCCLLHPPSFPVIFLPMHVVIFEGSRWPTFAPMSLSRPVFDLATGASTLLEKQIRHMRPTRLTLWVRPELEAACQERIAPFTGVPTAVNQPLDGEAALLVSGRTVHLVGYEPESEESVATDEHDLVQHAFVRSPGLAPVDAARRSDRWLELLKLPRVPPQSRMVNSLWDLIHWNEESLIEDYAHRGPEPADKAAGPYHMVEDSDVWIGAGVILEPGCVLDASKGQW